MRNSRGDDLRPVGRLRDLGGAEGVQVQRVAGGDAADQRERGVRAGVLGDRALHADLGGAELPGLVDECVEVVGVVHQRRREVAVDDDGQRVADGVTAHRVGQGAQGLELVAVGAEQLDVARVGQAGRVALGGAEPGAHGGRCAHDDAATGSRTAASPCSSASAATAGATAGSIQPSPAT